MSESAGFLNDTTDWSTVDGDPNNIADGKYAAFVFDSKLEPRKKGGTNWVLTYKIAPGELHAGQVQKEWKNTNPTGETRSQQLGYLKQRVLSLGVPEAKVGSFKHEDIIGTPVWITIYHREGNQNIGAVSVRHEAGTTTAAAPTTSASPTAGLDALL